MGFAEYIYVYMDTKLEQQNVVYLKIVFNFVDIFMYFKLMYTRL